jgi:hypothetical protein
VAEDAVYRGLSEEGAADWNALARSQLFREWVERGALIGTEAVAAAAAPELDGRWAAVLRHERIPVVSYPYEWSFGMLKAAALLQLELLLAALDEDLIVKDGSPYNVQWRGTRPVFVDVGSLEAARPGEPWAGYRQFCMLFLYPLMLQAYKGVAFQPWLRGRVDGIEPAEFVRLLSLRDRFRHGVTTHAVLHARLEARYADRAVNTREELRSAGFGKELVRANARKLHKLVRALEWTPAPSAWSGYSSSAPYGDADAEQKAEFVRAVAASRDWNLVWDLGANDGRYARIAAERARYVLAVDADHAVVEHLYRDLAAEEATRILPLLVDVADPSPGLGWRGRERATLAERCRPELILCLALVHHLAITRNIPVVELLDWLRELETVVVIEFPTRDDAMVQRLLAPKAEGLHADYDRPVFERLLAERFSVERTEELGSGTRVLYLARPP